MVALWRVEQIWIVLIGLTIGSFLNVVIARLPENRSLWPRSACPSCGSAIRAVDNVPVLSYLWLKGGCRQCHAPIPATYPLVELLGGLVAWLSWQRCVPTPSDFDAPHLVAWAFFFAFLSMLIAVTQIDVRHRIIPDELSIYAVPFGILGSVLLTWLGYTAWPLVDWHTSVLGALAGGCFLGAIAVTAEYILGREGLGWGDVKLMAMIGAFVGLFPGVLFVLFVGAVFGSMAGLVHLAVTRRRSYLPMGPFLALAAAAYVLFGDTLVRILFPGVAMLIPALN